MKIYNLEKKKDIEKLFKVIEKCEGKVELVTSEGDRLNLKSKLCQFISLTNILSVHNSEIPELEIVAYNPNDTIRIANFLMYH